MILIDPLAPLCATHQRLGINTVELSYSSHHPLAATTRDRKPSHRHLRRLIVCTFCLRLHPFRSQKRDAFIETFFRSKFQRLN